MIFVIGFRRVSPQQLKTLFGEVDMKFIVTQRLRKTSKGFDNAGGLYLNIDHISAVLKGDDRQCNVLMQDGTVFIVTHSISDILDMIPFNKLN